MLGMDEETSVYTGKILYVRMKAVIWQNLLWVSLWPTLLELPTVHSQALESMNFMKPSWQILEWWEVMYLSKILR